MCPSEIEILNAHSPCTRRIHLEHVPIAISHMPEADGLPAQAGLATCHRKVLQAACSVGDNVMSSPLWLGLKDLSCCVVLRCGVMLLLCCVALCRLVLCCVVLCCVVLCCVVLGFAVLCCVVCLCGCVLCCVLLCDRSVLCCVFV